MTLHAPPTLHVPDEPTARAEDWLAAVSAGAQWVTVMESDGGPIDWLWSRWSFLERSGMGRNEFGAVALEYRRELWLWVAGERTWAQCCSGLVGRVTRRLAQVAPAT